MQHHGTWISDGDEVTFMPLFLLFCCSFFTHSLSRTKDPMFKCCYSKYICFEDDMIVQRNARRLTPTLCTRVHRCNKTSKSFFCTGTRFRKYIFAVPCSRAFHTACTELLSPTTHPFLVRRVNRLPFSIYWISVAQFFIAYFAKRHTWHKYFWGKVSFLMKQKNYASVTSWYFEAGDLRLRLTREIYRFDNWRQRVMIDHGMRAKHVALVS